MYGNIQQQINTGLCCATSTTFQGHMCQVLSLGKNLLQRLGDMCALSGMTDHSGQQIGRSVGPQNELTSSCIWISTGVQVPVLEFNMHELSITCSHTRCQSTPCCTVRSLCRNSGHSKVRSLKCSSKVSINRSMLTDQGLSKYVRQMRMHPKQSLSASETSNRQAVCAEAQHCKLKRSNSL